MSALARWCFRHRLTVAGAWATVLLALGGFVAVSGTSFVDAFSLPHTDSTKALDLLTTTMPGQSGDRDAIVLHVTTGTVRDQAVQQRVAPMLDRVAHLPSVALVAGPYGSQGAAQVSKDGRTAYASVLFDAQANKIPVGDIKGVVNAAQAVDGNGLAVELSGQAIKSVSQPAPADTELIGIVAAALILFVAFGSLLGMLTPLLVAIAGLGAGLLSLSALSHVITLPTIAPTLAALIGLGVGIDYALFIVTRYRTGLAAGMTAEEAAIEALSTSGRAVLFAGGTVVIALLGLLVLQVNFLAGMGIGAAITVVWTVLAAVTLLPAVLGFFGMRLLTNKQRRALTAGGPAEQTAGFWARWAEAVARRKAVYSLVAVAIIAALSIPTLSIRLGSSDSGNDPAGTTTRKAYDLLAKGFGPGFNGPLELVASLPAVADGQAFDRLTTAVRAAPGVAAAVGLPRGPGATVGVLEVVPTTSPQSQQTDQLINRLRADIVPAAERGSTMRAYVGGTTATFKDFASVLTGKLPLFLGVIIALGCLLLLLAFRSIVVPLTAAVMNLFATAASFGVVIAVFQFGWGSEALGAGAAGPVEAFLPVIMLAILFGLSMDYQVFLVSRIHEEWAATHDNRRAVIVGQAETGRVITAAASIMVCVFLAFVLDGERVIAEFGIGLAAAVAIDALLLRTILVPSLMHLFGSANWWLPGWLDRLLPHVSIESAGSPPDGGRETGSGSDLPAQRQVTTEDPLLRR